MTWLQRALFGRIYQRQPWAGEPKLSNVCYVQQAFQASVHLPCRHKEMWCVWATQERCMRQLQHARNIYRRAMGRKLDAGAQQVVCMEWLRFEREEGRWVQRAV